MISDGLQKHNTGIDLTLIICSRNRAHRLQRCLDRLSTSELSSVNGKLVLVDNGSSDDTRVVMQRAVDRAVCAVEIVSVPRSGLSRARNAGLSRAEGNTIVFTDDDCYLENGYLQHASRVFDDGRFSYCGGRILQYNPRDALCGQNLQKVFELVPPDSFIPAGKFQGANLVVHQRVFDCLGGFDEQLGAGTPFRCEDIEFVARASHAGFTGAHVPELVVSHDHGRKADDMIELNAANDRARGAYYAIFLRRRKLGYLGGWLRNSFGRKDFRKTIPKFLRELSGAIGYMKAKAETHG